MSYIDNLINKGFDGGDIHYFSCYFNIGIKVKNPYETSEGVISRLEKEAEERKTLELLSFNGSAEQILAIVNAGKIGMTYDKDTYNKILSSL